MLEIKQLDPARHPIQAVYKIQTSVEVVIIESVVVNKVEIEVNRVEEVVEQPNRKWVLEEHDAREVDQVVFR